jgi:hypothetical protein
LPPISAFVLPSASSVRIERSRALSVSGGTNSDSGAPATTRVPLATARTAWSSSAASAI